MPRTGPGSGRDAGAEASPATLPTAVIDTNAWLDLFVFRDLRAQCLALALQQREVLALRSSRTDAEVHAVLKRPLFAAKCDELAREALMRGWATIAHNMDVEPIRPSPWTCRDRDDQKFLDLAYTAGAAWLFTKDRALLDLARKTRPAGMHILTPQMFAATRSGSQT